MGGIERLRAGCDWREALMRSVRAGATELKAKGERIEDIAEASATPYANDRGIRVKMMSAGNHSGMSTKALALMVAVVVAAVLLVIARLLQPGEPPNIRISVGEWSMVVVYPKSTGPITVTIPGGYEYVVAHKTYHTGSPWKIMLAEWLDGSHRIDDARYPFEFRHPVTGGVPTQPLRGHQVIHVRVGRWTGVWRGTPTFIPFREDELQWSYRRLNLLEQLEL